MPLSRMTRTRHEAPAQERPTRYQPPDDVNVIALSELLARIGRPGLQAKQMALLQRDVVGDVLVHYAGELSLLDAPAVSIVGTREVSEDGRMRASRLARELAGAGVLVVSGLAKGVDAAAHRGALQAGGATAAVIGTPLDKAYPAENARLQEEIYRHHLLVSPFAAGSRVFKGNFPARNRVMAAVTDATVIIEASDTSGTLHQAAECQRLGRWLFILRSVVENPHLTWPRNFIGKPKVAVLSSTQDVIDAIQS